MARVKPNPLRSCLFAVIRRRTRCWANPPLWCLCVSIVCARSTCCATRATAGHVRVLVRVGPASRSLLPRTRCACRCLLVSGPGACVCAGERLRQRRGAQDAEAAGIRGWQGVPEEGLWCGASPVLSAHRRRADCQALLPGAPPVPLSMPSARVHCLPRVSRTHMCLAALRSSRAAREHLLVA